MVAPGAPGGVKLPARADPASINPVNTVVMIHWFALIALSPFNSCFLTSVF
jgi:hypothetical protein